MSHVIVWTNNALEELERAYFFLSEKSEEAAVTAIKAIREKALLLDHFPYAGRPADDLEPEHRELLIPFGETGYIMLYRIDHSHIHILALRHQKEVNYKVTKNQ